MSEFGRRASEDGSVDGGKVHGEWPGLEEGQRIGLGDLAVTTDDRDVLSEILVKRLNNPAGMRSFRVTNPGFEMWFLYRTSVIARVFSLALPATSSRCFFGRAGVPKQSPVLWDFA